MVDDAVQHVADDGRQLVVVGAVVEDGLVAHAVKVQAEIARGGGRDGDEQRDAHHENISVRWHDVSRPVDDARRLDGTIIEGCIDTIV